MDPRRRLLFDTHRPHHVITEDNEDRWNPHCKCGYNQSGYVPGLANTYVDQHVIDSYDGRCHFKRYGMECGRYDRHRGLHRVRTAGGRR